MAVEGSVASATVERVCAGAAWLSVVCGADAAADGCEDTLQAQPSPESLHDGQLNSAAHAPRVPQQFDFDVCAVFAAQHGAMSIALARSACLPAHPSQRQLP